MILIIREDRRLCNDKKWREMAPFGSESICVKVYKQLARARKIRDSQNALLTVRRKTPDVRIVNIPTGVEINAVGQVMKLTPVGDGTERVEHIPLTNFIVE